MPTAELIKNAKVNPLIVTLKVDKSLTAFVKLLIPWSCITGWKNTLLIVVTSVLKVSILLVFWFTVDANVVFSKPITKFSNNKVLVELGVWTKIKSPWLILLLIIS